MGTVTTDLMITGLFSLVGVAYLVWWVRFTPQKEVSGAFRELLWLTIRTVLFYGFVWMIACFMLGLRALETGVGTTAILLALPWIRWNAHDPEHGTGLERLMNFTPPEPAAGAIFIAVMMVLLLPLLLLREFILVDASDQPVPPQKGARDPSNSVLSGTYAVVVAPLKPYGIIEINGERINACSYSGGFISSGTHVQVCDDRQGLPVVREISNGLTTTKCLPAQPKA